MCSSRDTVKHHWHVKHVKNMTIADSHLEMTE